MQLSRVISKQQSIEYTDCIPLQKEETLHPLKGRGGQKYNTKLHLMMFQFWRSKEWGVYSQLHSNLKC